jgi:hypothetical protein
MDFGNDTQRCRTDRCCRASFAVNPHLHLQLRFRGRSDYMRPSAGRAGEQGAAREAHKLKSDPVALPWAPGLRQAPAE